LPGVAESARITATIINKEIPFIISFTDGTYRIMPEAVPN